MVLKHLQFCLFIFFLLSSCFCKQVTGQELSGLQQRAYLVESLLKIADPVLKNLEAEQLKKNMPVETNNKDRLKYTHLEAFGRLFAGMSPWLELGADDTDEGKLRGKYIQTVIKCIDNATNPQSNDFMNFNQGSQPLVDVAFFAQGLLRSQTQIWNQLGDATKKNVINALKASRAIKPNQSNWLLFSAMVEAAILQFEGSCEVRPIEYAIEMHEHWYKGDGAYGDGKKFHWDYYNSFVIQPMLLEVVHTMKKHKDWTNDHRLDSLQKLFNKRAVRYAAIQERLISPEATYPPIGRSLAYRFGAFQHLAKMALMEKLPPKVTPQQVRYALFSVIKKQFEMPGFFDNNGWLQIGLQGHQPAIGENYITTGSLYLCSEAYVILGLPASNTLWIGKNVDWTSRKIWNGENVGIDHYVDY